jgi:4-hydroxy-tetrahydrodipicolinate reductase
MVEAQHGALVYGSNFSIGVNLFFELNTRLAQLMHHHPQYAARIEETHHLQKKDAPSGTAISLAQDIIKANETYNKWTNGPAHEHGVLPVISYREEDVPGTHVITYSSAIDTISISHMAHSREGFAAGALAAAEWVVGKKGVYAFKEVLGL